MTDTNAKACEMIEQCAKRQHFTDVRYVTVRWEPYKPDGARQMKAKGRWQEQVWSGDYFEWKNCSRPEFEHAPETIADLSAQLEAANQRHAAALDSVARSRDAALVEAADAAQSEAEQSVGGEYYIARVIVKCILALRDKPAPGVTVQDVIRDVWGCCEELEDEAFSKLSVVKSEHEIGFWTGQKMTAKRIRRATQMPTAGGGDE